MRLLKVRVRNFRSIDDSGEIEIGDRTALVGRNESGKTNVLRALESLNPVGGIKALSDVKDFPRHRKLSEWTPQTPVLETTWEMTDGEMAELAALFPIDANEKSVLITRTFEAKQDVTFQGAATISADIHEKAKALVLGKLPVFIYVDEYPELNGHQDIAAYIQTKQTNPVSFTEADRNFEKLVKVADLNPEELHAHLNQDHDRRQLLTNRASAVITRKLREIWKDTQLKVRFNLDERHFDTLISDPSNVYDVEINLDDRSRGFKWFFSFYVTFAADTDGGPAENAILLLDEPGLFLHAVAQHDLLAHFASDYKNQILYTTHSPFMVPREIASVRTVSISQEHGTTVTNDPTGDSKTLFPIQQALGYDLTQTLFIGTKNLVVEGVTDYWYLQTISEYLAEAAGTGLARDITITPGGGAHKVTYMVALLSAQNLHVVVLLDWEQGARTAAEEMIKSKLIRQENVVFIAGSFGAQQPSEADIEDLLDPAHYGALVNASYAKELANVHLSLNANIPRVVKRYEDAFKAAGLEFNKTRPAKLFLRDFPNAPTKYLSQAAQGRVEALFASVNAAMQALERADRPPFQ